MLTTELAWAAGFFDGEGNVGYYKNQWKGKIIVQIGQTDSEVLHRFQRALGVGYVAGPYGPYHVSVYNRKPLWVYRAGKQEDVKQIYSLLKQYLSNIKAKQFEKALERVQ